MTTLIGLSYKGKPLIGIIGQHFVLLKEGEEKYNYEKYQYKYQPISIFCHANCK